MNVQIIKQDGKPEYVVLPYAEYLDLIEQLEDREDMAAVEAYHHEGEDTYPSEVVDPLLDGEQPIKVFRRWRKMTQVELAAKIEKSKDYIAKLEAGDRQGSAAVLRDIAAALEIDIDQLI